MDYDEVATRSYWARRLDEAHAFMMRALDYPVAQIQALLDRCRGRNVTMPD